jgi:hypothetical protein
LTLRVAWTFVGMRAKRRKGAAPWRVGTSRC